MKLSNFNMYIEITKSPLFVRSRSRETSARDSQATWCQSEELVAAVPRVLFSEMVRESPLYHNMNSMFEARVPCFSSLV